MASFKDCIGYCLENEGGYTVDSGGPTNYGITIPALAVFRGVSSLKLSARDIKMLTADEAMEIYLKDYWKPLRLDDVMDQAIQTAMLDTGINRGPKVSAIYAQRACNMKGAALVCDGEMGLHTITALNAIRRGDFIRAFQALETAGYLAIVAHDAAYKVYEKGWLARASRLLTLIAIPIKETPAAP